MNQATNPRARGALFTTGKGGGFRLSASDGSGQPTLFGHAVYPWIATVIQGKIPNIDGV